MAAANTGRRAKPRALKLIDGNAGHRPIPEEVDFPRGAPTKPSYLSSHASELWDRLVPQLETAKLLKPVNGPALEQICETYSRWREAVAERQRSGITHENSQGTTAAPWTGVEERAGREFRAWCAEFGITPAAEAKLAPADPTPGEANPFA